MKSRSEKGRYTLTMHNSKKFGSPKHNDRNFDLSKNQSIDPERVKDNLYYNLHNGFYCSDFNTLSFEEIERQFYAEHFQAKVDKTNENYIKQRHKEKCINIRQYYSKHPPEESIFEIGDIDNHPDSTVLGHISHDFIEWHEKHFPGIVILNAAIHLDENTPHMHVRKVFTHKDKNGLEEVQMKGCLKDLGIERPDLTKKESRNNNRQQSYTKMIREKLISLCKEYNLEIITETNLNRPKDISKYDYILAKQNDEYQEVKINKDKAKEELGEIETNKDKAEKELEKIGNKSATINLLFSKKKRWKRSEIADLIAEIDNYKAESEDYKSKYESTKAEKDDLKNKLKRSQIANKELINDKELMSEILADKGISKSVYESYKDYMNAPGRNKKNINEYQKAMTSKGNKEKERDIYSR